jgi:hypothetical protein
MYYNINKNYTICIAYLNTHTSIERNIIRNIIFIEMITKGTAQIIKIIEYTIYGRVYLEVLLINLNKLPENKTLVLVSS